MTTVVTAYCICKLCCGKIDGVTASGAIGIPGVTAAANHLPFGTKIHIPGVGWRTVQDRMSFRHPNRIDILTTSHHAAKRFGIRKLKITIVPPRKPTPTTRS